MILIAFPLPLRRSFGTGIDFFPERYFPVKEFSSLATSSGVPAATICPPCSPAQVRRQSDNLLPTSYLHHVRLQRGCCQDHAFSLMSQSVDRCRVDAIRSMVHLNIQNSRKIRSNLCSQSDSLRFSPR